MPARNIRAWLLKDALVCPTEIPFAITAAGNHRHEPLRCRSVLDVLLPEPRRSLTVVSCHVRQVPTNVRSLARSASQA